MVASVPYVKSIEPHLLETYTPEVTQAFVTSRLESVGVIMRYDANVLSPNVMLCKIHIYY